MPVYIIPKRFQLRGFTAAECASKNEPLMDREHCYETDTGRAKFGDGATPFRDRLYSGWGFADLDALIDGSVLVYDATLGHWVPSSTAGYTDEQAQDAAAAMLVAGSHSGISVSYNDAGNALTLTASGSGSGVTHVGTATVAGSAATTLTLSGLDLATDDRYFIDYAIDNATASNTDISLYFNGDTTATNYYNQTTTIAGSSATAGAGRSNNGKLCIVEASETATGQANTTNDRDGKPRTMASTCRATASLLNQQLTAHVWNSATNITSLTLSSSVASALAVGSYFRVFKVTN